MSRVYVQTRLSVCIRRCGSPPTRANAACPTAPCHPKRLCKLSRGHRSGRPLPSTTNCCSAPLTSFHKDLQQRNKTNIKQPLGRPGRNSEGQRRPQRPCECHAQRARRLHPLACLLFQNLNKSLLQTQHYVVYFICMRVPIIPPPRPVK